jgi:nucleotidyltransferase/DNA polymerase involved in DNA repair
MAQPPANKRTKAILHIDGDAFFVGVEVAKNPNLKNLPVVTGQERGIVSALSYEAKALGITRGMPIYQVHRQFPNVIVLPGDYKAYVTYSAKMFAIVRRYVDDVEEYSIDECFGDLTGLDKPLKMTYLHIAERIKQEIRDELGLSVSIGIAPTKVLAKIASKWVKPNGLTIILPESVADFLETPIEGLWGIGPRTSEILKQKGIATAADFVKKELRWIQETLSKPYETIWRELQGEYVLPIDPVRKTTYASIQKTRSFHPNTNDTGFLLAELSKHVESACDKARHYKLAPAKVSFFLKTKDFKIVSTTIQLPVSTNVPEIIVPLIYKAFAELHKKRVLYRTTGVVLQNLSVWNGAQQDLFGDRSKADKFEIIHTQIDALETKLGKHVVHLASTQRALKQKRTETDYDDVDRDLLFL